MNIKSKETLGNPYNKTLGYNSFSFDMDITTGFTTAYAVFPESGHIPNSSKESRYWGDWGNDIFDSWGNFYIYNQSRKEFEFLPFDINEANKRWDNMSILSFSAWGNTFILKYGFAAQGIFRIIIEPTQKTDYKFAVGAYGGMGSDSRTNNSFINGILSINGESRNFKYNRNQDNGNNIEILYSYVFPYEFDATRYPSNMYSSVINGDNYSFYSAYSNEGIILYFSKTYDVVEWIKDDLRVSDIPPTKPNSFIKAPKDSDVIMMANEIDVSWEKSTDPEGSEVFYELSLYNGSSWIIIESKLTETSKTIQLPDGMWTDQAKLRVRAFDSNNLYSDYLVSNAFRINRALSLIEDNGIIRTLKEGKWTTVEMPTKEQFKEHGMADLSLLTAEAIAQLESDNFKILVYTEDPTLTNLDLEITAIPKRQLVIQESDLLLVSPIQKMVLNATVTGNSVLRVILSTDEGETWSSYKNGSWETVAIDNLDQIANRGMTKEELAAITQEVWKAKLSKQKVRLAYYLDLDKVTDTLILDNLTYTTIPIVESTPKITGIDVTYKDLTVEGRLKELERINHINLSKLNFKSNALLKSRKYSMHDMVVNTFDADEMITISSSTDNDKRQNIIFSEPKLLEDKWYISSAKIGAIKNIKSIKEKNEGVI